MLADFVLARPRRLFCEKYLTLPYLADEDAIISKIYLRRSSHLGERISSTYEFDNRRVIIYQVNLEYFNNGENYLSIENCIICNIQLPSGIIVDGVLSTIDNTFIGTTTIDSFAIKYVITNCKDEEDIASILKNLTMK